MAGDSLTLEGTVTRTHRGDLYSVRTPAIDRVLAKRSARLFKNAIRIIPGDRVTIEVSPYDTRRGRIVRRLDPVRTP